MLTLAQAASYSGCVLSACIAFNLFKIRSNLNFFNTMFMIYYSIDGVVGCVETVFLFNLRKQG